MNPYHIGKQRLQCYTYIYIYIPIILRSKDYNVTHKYIIVVITDVTTSFLIKFQH